MLLYDIHLYKHGGYSQYNDQELSEALACHNLSRKDISPSLDPLIRKPRYFDLMVKFREEMEESGDVTPARLVYEDWRDRYGRKTGMSLDHKSFQDLIRGLAQGHLNGATRVTQHQVEQLLPVSSQRKEVIQEIATGGVLEGTGNRYKVNVIMLVHGFGLLLSDLVEQVASNGQSAINEAIASWLEPVEMDIKAAICEHATYHALVTPKYPQEARIALVRAWLESPNAGPEMEDNFSAYFPLDPEAYIKLAELVWSDENENRWGQELIMHTLLKWRDRGRFSDIYVATFEKWFGYVHIAGYPIGEEPKTSGKPR